VSHSAPSMSNAFPNLWSNVPQPATDLDHDPIGEIPRPVFHFRLGRRKRHPPPCAPRLDCAKHRCGGIETVQTTASLGAFHVDINPGCLILSPTSNNVKRHSTRQEALGVQE
jgi:hypothetical protein